MWNPLHWDEENWALDHILFVVIIVVAHNIHILLFNSQKHFNAFLYLIWFYYKNVVYSFVSEWQHGYYRDLIQMLGSKVVSLLSTEKGFLLYFFGKI